MHLFSICVGYIVDSSLRVICLIVYHLLLLPFLVTYIAVIKARKLEIPPDFRLNSEEVAEIQLARSHQEDAVVQDILRKHMERFNLPVLTRARNGDVRYCGSCASIKPDRAHHCSTCRRCILRMDHHCPWTSTCIGLHNHKQFMQFLVSTLLYVVFVFVATIGPLVDFLRPQASVSSSDQQTQSGYHRPRPLPVLLALMAIVSIGLLVSLVPLTVYQMWLISRNRTGLECMWKATLDDGRRSNSLYDLGYAANWRSVFGSRCTYWFVPVFSAESDGITYSTSAGSFYRRLHQSDEAVVVTV